MLALIARAMPRASQQRSVLRCMLIVLRYIKAHAEKSIVTKEFRAACPRADRSCAV
jgi:hypothetical protein